LQARADPGQQGAEADSDGRDDDVGTEAALCLGVAMAVLEDQARRQIGGDGVHGGSLRVGSARPTMPTYDRVIN
jgi:hypothetical protein